MPSGTSERNDSTARGSRLVRDEFRRDGPFRKRRLPGEHEVQRAPERVDVGAHVHHVRHRLFGREIIGRAKHALVVVLLSYAVLLLVEESRQPHVENFDHAGAVEEQVPRLDVAVNHAQFVRVLHPDRGLCDVMCGANRVEQFLLQRVAPDDFLQTVPVHVLHDQEVQLVVLIDVVGADDVRVVERGDGAGLAVEPVQVRLVLEFLHRQHLERHQPPHERVFAQVHGAHAAGADQLEQPVLGADREPLVAPELELLGLEEGELGVADQQLPPPDRRSAGSPWCGTGRVAR